MTSKQQRDLGIGKQRGRMRELIGELRDVDAGLHVMDGWPGEGRGTGNRAQRGNALNNGVERGVVVGVQRWCSKSEEAGTGLGDYRTQGYTGLRGRSRLRGGTGSDEAASLGTEVSVGGAHA